MDNKLKFGVYSLIIIIFQSCLKIYGVIVTGSLSFLSETVDTLTDIIFVSITLYSLKISQKPPDYEHMYGHSKIDSVGAMIQGMILVLLYIILIGNAILVLLSGEYVVSNPEIGLQILVISFCVNIVFSRILIWQGRRRKSLTLEIQGLNLFQDSMRALVVMGSFIFILFKIFFLDIFISITLSIWIIYGAFKLTKQGVNDLSDINPVNLFVLEELRKGINDLEHVNAVDDIKIRAFGKKLFLDVRLSVEDHISIAHANEIMNWIRAIEKRMFPVYDVECIIEMNPLAGEKSLGENIINLIYSLKSEFPDILEVNDLNLFNIQNESYLSLVIIMDENLSLNKAHILCTNFEEELKKQAPELKRIISHIESKPFNKLNATDLIECANIDDSTKITIKNIVENILKSNPEVKGYHGFEFWSALKNCILQFHVFLDGELKINRVHQIIDDLELKLRETLKIDNLSEIILHSEPFKGRKDGVFFQKDK